MTSSASLRHLATVFYKRTGLDELKKQLRFNGLCEPDNLPKRNGQTVQWYRFTLPGSNTTPSSEGTVGVGLTADTNTISATVSQYSDYYSVSTLLQDTAIDPFVENLVRMASYRASLTVDVLARTELHSTTTPERNTLGATITAADFRRARALLNGIDVREGPRGSNEFVSPIHPYALYDVKSDNTAGGFIDVMKYAQPKDLLGGEVGMIDGVRLVQTTNVKTSGTAPAVKYFTPVVGRGAIGSVALEGSAPSQVTDPDKQSFKINVVKGGPNTADPEGNIGAFVSYRFVQVFKILDSTNYRYIVILADASLV